MKIHLYLNGGMVCNSSVGKEDSWPHSFKHTYVTCKHCLKSLEKGIQIKLDIPKEDEHE